MEIFSRSEKETFGLGRRLASRLTGGESILLFGELGSGKTVLAKGLAAGLGVAETVTSPTYLLVRSYRGKSLNLYHFDFYRLRSKAALSRLDLPEFLSDSRGVFVFEWPELVGRNLPGKVFEIHLENVGKKGRRIKISESGLRSR